MGIAWGILQHWSQRIYFINLIILTNFLILTLKLIKPSLIILKQQFQEQEMQAGGKEKLSKILYVIGTNDPNSDETKINIVSSVAKKHFKIYIGDPKKDLKEKLLTLVPIEQQKRNTGHDKTSFLLKKQLQVKEEEIMVKFPITCVINSNKMTIPEEQMRRLLIDFRTLYQNDDTNQSEFSELSYDQSEKAQESNRGRGRPKGSKNKKKDDNIDSSSDEEYENSEAKRGIKKPSKGRPKGSKNKKKQIQDDQIFHELNFHNLFKKLFQNRSYDEINKKMNKDKVRVKEQHIEEEIQGKRARGRPKGRKNKSKMEEEVDSEANISDTLPDRIDMQKYDGIICCSKCNQRQNKKLYLEGKLRDKSVLRNIAENVGVQDTTNLVIQAIKNGRAEDLKELMGMANRIQNDFLVPWDCNNRLEQTSYTFRTRKDFVRKQKQMINAMLQDRFVFKGKWWQIIGIQRIIECIPHYESGIQMYKILIDSEPELKTIFYENIPSVVRCGNYPLAYILISEMFSQTQMNLREYGYSREHLDCLNKERSELHFKKMAMLKQNCTFNFCSPIHCAVINPNIQLLSYILKHISEFNVGDSLGRKPIHYASTLESPKAMEILLKFGGDLKEIDKRKMTPLIIAAKFGRYKILKFILEKVREKQYINFKDDNELCALHYATISKHQQCISLLLDDPLINKYEETKQKFTILHLAAGGGDKQIVRTILNGGVKSTFDHFRRSPLIIALRNHHNDIFFQFLKEGIPNFKKDYSNNTLLHYAAAYGNLQLVLYLNKIIDQIPNKKNFYPWEIAILKGHLYCAKLLEIKENKIINFPQHHHLIFLLLKNPRGTQEYISMIKYLLNTNVYQLNYQYNDIGDTCLHLLCQMSEKYYYEYRKKESSVIGRNQYEDMQKTLIKLLLEHGSNDQIQNERGQKPVNLCIENQNIVGIQLLLKQIPFEVQYTNKNNHFVYYLTKIACRGAEEMIFVRQKLSNEDDRVLKSELKRNDCQGFQFLVFLIKNFTECVHQNFKKNYIRHIEEFPENSRQNPQNQNFAIKKAFQDYVEHEACLLDLVNFLVEKGSDPKRIVNQPKVQGENENYKKWGIQHFLMRFPSLVLLKAFAKWIDTSFNTTNSEGRTPLHLFSMLNRQGCLFNGHNMDISPVPYINFKLSSDYQGQNCLQYLLDIGLNLHVWDINRSTPFLYAALNGQLKFMKILRQFGGSTNLCNLINQVPLIELIKSKDKFKLDQLIEEIDHFFDPNITSPLDLDSRSALHHLVSNAKNFDNSPELCKKLLQHICINSVDKYGRSPIFYCFIKIDSGVDKSQVKKSDRKQDRNNDKVEILQTLLSCQKIDLNIIDIYGKTLLHYACEKYFFFSILYLLNTNINYEVKDKEGNTPLAICLKHRNLNQAALLIRKGVKYGNVIENNQTYSYFSYAAAKLSVGICYMLLDHDYPLQYAIEEAGNAQFKKILRKKYESKSYPVVEA